MFVGTHIVHVVQSVLALDNYYCYSTALHFLEYSRNSLIICHNVTKESHEQSSSPRNTYIHAYIYIYKPWQLYTPESEVRGSLPLINPDEDEGV